MYDYNYKVYPQIKLLATQLHIYLSNMTGYQKPLAQQCWQPIVTSQTVKISSHKEQKTYILATPHRHNVTVINKRTTVVVKNTNIIDQVNMI